MSGGGRRNRVRVFVAVAATALSAIAAVAPQARANSGLYITLSNGLRDSSVRLVAAHGASCWNDGDLGRQRPVQSGQSLGLYTEKKNELFSGCNSQNAARGIDLQVNELGGWQTPTGSPGGYHIYFVAGQRSSNFGFNFRDSLATWVPRADGRGLVCWKTNTSTGEPVTGQGDTTGYATINVLGNERCNTPAEATIPPGPKLSRRTLRTSRRSPADVAEPAGSPQVATSSSAGGDAQTAAGKDAPDANIVDLLSTVGVACGWYAYPGNQAHCDRLNVGDQTKWVIDNAPRRVAHLEATNPIVNYQPKHPVGKPSTLSIPATSPEGTVSVRQLVRTRTETQTTTTHGFGVGTEFSFTEKGDVGLPGLASGGLEFTQKLSAEYNYSNSTAQSTSEETEIDVAVSAGAAPGYVTTLDVFTTKVDANYEYSADLEFGKPGGVTPVVTPGTQALNMSPATRHPCLAYLVGDKSVRNSITNIGKALADAGHKENEPTLAAERRAFLRGVPGFRTASTPCPGFPQGFASQAAFKGRGVGTYDNLGYDPGGNARSAMIGCVYQRPLQPRAGSSRTPRTPRRAQASAADSPCQTLPGGAGRVDIGAPGSLGAAGSEAQEASAKARGAGVLIEARGAGRTRGTPVSDKVIGGGRDERISTGSGTFDQVHARGGDDLVSGGPGEDLIHGGKGDDDLDGGGGFDTVHGGGGDDRVRERGGSGSLNGDGGADTLIATGNHQLTIVGGRGDDRLVSRGKSASSLGGGPGDDTYVLAARGNTNVFEMPGEGTDVLKTKRGIHVPSEIEKATATGARRVELRSGDGRQTLVGNGAANVLEAGTESDRVRGGGGGDRILLNEFGFDRVTGGKGGDSFVPLGSPANADRPAGLEDPPHRTAHRITDFRPRRGDRVVMRASVFGKELLEQRRKLAIVRDRNPRPRGHRATLLFDDRTGLVSFDRDGTGPISDKVAVVLPDAKALKRSWLEIRG